MPAPPVVAIFNTSPDVIDMLRFTFEHAGFVVVTGMTFDLRDAEIDLEQFVRQHQPDVIVYDVAPPYEENWRLFQHLCGTPALRSLPTVITTTNARQVEKFAGRSTQIHEIVGKPYDLDQIVSAAKDALVSRPASQ